MKNGGPWEGREGRGDTGHALWGAPTSVDLGEEEGKERSWISKTLILREKGGEWRREKRRGGREGKEERRGEERRGREERRGERRGERGEERRGVFHLVFNVHKTKTDKNFPQQKSLLYTLHTICNVCTGRHLPECSSRGSGCHGYLSLNRLLFN